MDTPTKRPLKEPTRECQYGTGCYRKNPQHFGEYAHKHLTDIRNKGRNASTGAYTVPDALFMSREVVLDQLQIFDRLYPVGATPVKRPKPDDQKTDAATSTASLAAAVDRAAIQPRKERIDVPTSVASSSSSSVAAVCATVATIVPKKEPEIKVEKMSQKPSAISAAQLQLGLTKAAVVATTTASTSSAITAASITQAEQLAAYRARHITQLQNKPTVAAASTIVASTSSSVAVAQPSNPHSRPPPKNIQDYISVVRPRGKMEAKLAAAAPYNFFLTTITASPATHAEPLSITFQEILDESLGTIESSVQMNFMVDIGWLLGHYYFAGCLDKPMLVLYGDSTPELETIKTKKPQVTAVKVQMSSPFGTHHTKMMLLGYTDGSMRVIVSTANLVEDDWHNRTQGLWMSPRCPRMPPDADTAAGAGPTNFRDDLVRYLVTYSVARLQLQPWITRVRQSDFSAVNVFFVASVPGGHRQTPRGHDWGHARLGHLLGRHSAPVDDSCPIVAQSSSIGSLGPSVQSWIMADIVNSLRRDTVPVGLRRLPAFRMVYPSFANVRASHDDLLGGGGLPYRRAVDVKQPWLKEHLYQWKSTARHRSHAMPHIKTYCRWSHRGLYWFCLTSANLSKAAWGAFNRGSKLDAPLRIMSYEAGVLFVPKFVLRDDEARFFPMGRDASTTQPNGGTVPPFPMPYDAELQPYGAADVPFVMDYLLERM